MGSFCFDRVKRRIGIQPAAAGSDIAVTAHANKVRGYVEIYAVAFLKRFGIKFARPLVIDRLKSLDYERFRSNIMSMRVALLVMCVLMSSFGCRMMPPSANAIANAERKAEERAAQSKLILSVVHLETDSSGVLHITRSVTNPNGTTMDLRRQVTYLSKEATPISVIGTLTKNPLPPRDSCDIQILVHNPPAKPAYG